MTDAPPEKKSALRAIRQYGVLALLRSRLRRTALNLSWFIRAKVWGMDIHPNTQISLKAKLDRTNPRGIHIGEGSAMSFGAVMLSHDMTRTMHVDTRIGKFCQVGTAAIILPGITIGDHCVIGAGTVVTKDVPSNSMVVGNPGRIIRTGIQTGFWGILTDRGVAAPTKPSTSSA